MPAHTHFNTTIDFHQAKHVSTMTALKLIFTYPWKMDCKNATEKRALTICSRILLSARIHCISQDTIRRVLGIPIFCAPKSESYQPHIMIHSLFVACEIL